jgi:hypothetical protein
MFLIFGIVRNKAQPFKNELSSSSRGCTYTYKYFGQNHFRLTKIDCSAWFGLVRVCSFCSCHKSLHRRHVLLWQKQGAHTQKKSYFWTIFFPLLNRLRQWNEIWSEKLWQEEPSDFSAAASDWVECCIFTNVANRRHGGQSAADSAFPGVVA